MFQAYLTSAVCSLALTAAALAGNDEPAFNIETIAADGMWNNRASMDIDADGVIHLIWAGQSGTDSSTAEVYYANNAGGNWSISQITDNDEREEFPCLTLDDDGNVHVAVHTGIPGGNHIRYTNNIGAPVGEFNEWINITPPFSPFYVIVELRVDSRGTAHFVFRSQTSTAGENVFYTTWSEKDGVGSLQNLSNESGAFAGSAQVAIGPDDAVHVVWTVGSFGGTLNYRKKEPGGSFVPISTGVGSVIDPMILVSDDDVVSIIYRQNNVLWMVEAEEGGTMPFSSPQALFTGVTALPAFYERFALGPDGRRHVAFASNSQDLRGVWYIGETDSGWGDPIYVAGEATGNQGTSIAIGPDGDVVVGYSLSGFDGVVFADLFVATLKDDAPCVGDLNSDGVVNVSDLLILLGNWGTCDDCSNCPADLNYDCTVNVSDLLILLGNWGTCP